MNTIFGNFLERTIPNLRDAIINLTIGGNSSVMNLEDFKALMAPEPTPPTPIPEPSYKVYTALVTQSGLDDPIGIDTGLLTIGVTYYINNDSPGMDFTNVGAPNNNLGISFVATGTTPSSWGANEGTFNGTLVYNVGAPTVKVLENTIGDIWFRYRSTGVYEVHSNSLFTQEKTYLTIELYYSTLIGNKSIRNSFYYGDDSFLYLEVQQIIEADDWESINGRLTNTPIEIRVYN
jgi:hypothetical protein